MQERLIELENELQNKEQQVQMERKKMTLNEGYLQSELSEMRGQIQKLQIENKELFENSCKENNSKKDCDWEKMKERMNE